MKNRTAKRFAQVIIQTLLIAAILLVLGGTAAWLWAWLYLAVGVCVLAVNAVVLPADLIAERGDPKKNIKGWDRIITTISGVAGLALFVISGLDHRFLWSARFAPYINVVGLIGMATGQALFTWAMASNRFFSTAVRIQTDRKQTVATTGPYRFVRHPGYVGFMLSFIATPIALGSLWALIASVLIMVLLVIRTSLEDKMLRQELDGYGEYAQQVRYRLVPRVW